jgi:hypothetical protein
MEDDISLFDAPFFNMTSDEAAVRLTNPRFHHRVALIAQCRPWTPNRGFYLK